MLFDGGIARSRGQAHQELRCRQFAPQRDVLCTKLVGRYKCRLAGLDEAIYSFAYPPEQHVHKVVQNVVLYKQSVKKTAEIVSGVTTAP
jgi:hypothetical protein